MKINCIDIAGFGKFKNFHLDLSDGMTVIFGQNEQGKTTIMAFIRMMFYGNSGKSSDIEKNPRKKYRPWNGEIMAGSITFSHGGTLYRLEREFKASNSADKITLLNLDTGMAESLSGSDDIGAKFFGLTDAAFERSVFLEDRKAPVKNEAANGEINSRLSNISTTGDEDISFEKISSKILKAKEALFSKSKKIGRYDKAVLELEELNKTIISAKEKEESADKLKEIIETKEAELKAHSAENAQLFDALKKADKMKKRIFVERFLDCEKEVSAANEKLRLKSGNIADINFVLKAKELLEGAEKANDLLNTAKEAEKSAKAEVDKLTELTLKAEEGFKDNNLKSLYEKRDEIDLKIEENRAKTEELNQKLNSLSPTKKPNIPLIVLGAITLFAGAVLFILKIAAPLIPLIVLGAGLLVLILGFIFKIKTMPDDSEINFAISENGKKLSALLDQKEGLGEQIHAILVSENENKIAAAAEKALLENKKAELAQKSLALTAAKTDFTERFNALLEFVSNLSATESIESAKEVILSAEETIRFTEALGQKLTLLSDHANCKTKEEALEKLEEMEKSGVSAAENTQEIDNLKERFQAKSDQIGKIRSEIAALKAELKSIAQSTEPVSTLIRKREELEKNINEYKKFGEVANIATEVLEDAFKDLRKNFSGPLQHKTSAIFKGLVGDKYTDVSISKNFDLNVSTTEAFGIKESAFLSSGTEDQLYLSLRLATAELITEKGENLPIFMDDPLADYDDNRAENTFDFLKEYALSRQLIMFTCHKNFADMANNREIKITNL